jgi:hypothetical protein
MALWKDGLVHSRLAPSPVYRRPSLRDPDADLIQVPQQIGGVLIHSIGAGTLEFVLAVAAGEHVERGQPPRQDDRMVKREVEDARASAIRRVCAAAKVSDSRGSSTGL